MLRASYIQGVIAASLLTACASQGGLKAKKAELRFSEAQRMDAIRRAQVWEATDVASMDIRTGPKAHGSFAPDETVNCAYRDKVMSGNSPKFTCVIPPDDEVKVKFGRENGEVYAEVAATRLILMHTEKKNVVTLVTSSVMGEGKTTTAVNLAYILAHDLGKSTLLIDCDFKRPMVHEYMGVPVGPGLGDVLQGGEILENCLHPCEGVPLWVLPSGSPTIRPVGLSGIQYVKKILPDLKARYDHVILDAPPVMPLADVNILSGMTDMTAFVVRAGGTSQDIAKKALGTLGNVAGTAGIILTQVEMEYAPYFTYAAAYVNEDSETRV